MRNVCIPHSLFKSYSKLANSSETWDQPIQYLEKFLHPDQNNL